VAEAEGDGLAEVDGLGEALADGEGEAEVEGLGVALALGVGVADWLRPTITTTS